MTCRPQVRSQPSLLCFYGQSLSRTVPAGCTRPTCQNIRGCPNYWQPRIHIFTNFCENSKVLSRLLSVLSLSRKFVYDHCCCPKSAIILTAPKLEAILDFWWGYRNSVPNPMGGGGSLWVPPLPAQAMRAQAASGYTAADTILVISSMSLSSHFTFLCILCQTPFKDTAVWPSPGNHSNMVVQKKSKVFMTCRYAQKNQLRLSQRGKMYYSQYSSLSWQGDAWGGGGGWSQFQRHQKETTLPKQPLRPQI